MITSPKIFLEILDSMTWSWSEKKGGKKELRKKKASEVIFLYVRERVGEIYIKMMPIFPIQAKKLDESDEQAHREDIKSIEKEMSFVSLDEPGLLYCFSNSNLS